ncbi:MAG TPA: winged helix-turn-helix transcriptional regulator [Candidatus Thermoplasmatota archaeon]|nr:winged helix-turn-helix transcriptional regulator [Candidatus Thermoplasmatota archaeon]
MELSRLRADAQLAAARPSLRQEIHAFIVAHPAAHILEIAERFGLSHPTIMYHLDLLKSEGYVVSVPWGKRRVHFDAASHFTAWEREVLATFAADEPRAILEAVAASPGTFGRELAASLGLSTTTVKRHLPALLKLGLIAEVESGFRRRFAIGPQLVRRGPALLAKIPEAVGMQAMIRAVLADTIGPNPSETT